MKNLNQQPYLGKFQILYQLFIYCVVKQSAQLGLLGDLKNLIVSGDGTISRPAYHLMAQKYVIVPNLLSKMAIRFLTDVIATENSQTMMPPGAGTAIGNNMYMAMLFMKLLRLPVPLICRCFSFKLRPNAMIVR